MTPQLKKRTYELIHPSSYFKRPPAKLVLLPLNPATFFFHMLFIITILLSKLAK
jgi:hypothetical protein